MFDQPGEIVIGTFYCTYASSVLNMLTSGLLEYLASLKSFLEYLTIHDVYVNENQTLRVLRLYSGKNSSQLIVATDYNLLQSSD